MSRLVATLLLAVVLALAGCAPTVASEPQTYAPTGGFEPNAGPEGYYVVVENSVGAVITDLDVPAGSYTATYSKVGFRSQRWSFVVTGGQRFRLSPPILVRDESVQVSVRLTLDLANARGLVLLFDSQGRPVRDINDLRPGDYRVTFVGSGVKDTAMVSLGAEWDALVAVPAWVYQPLDSRVGIPVTPSTSPASSTSGMCWVNGYTKKNGTVVRGYWRRC